MKQFLVVNERLWVVTWVPAADWKKAIASATRYPDEVIIKTSDYFATRVDAYDLPSREHLGFTVFPRDRAQLLARGNEVLMQWVDEAEDGSFSIVVSRLDVPQTRR